MKKILAIATIVALTAVSCQKENEVKDQSKTIKVTVESAPLTKMGIKDGVQPVWTAGETAALISTSDYSVAATSKLNAPDIAGSKAAFTFEAIPEGNYRIISPSSSSISSDGVVFSISASQTQKELGLSGSRACMIGGAKEGADIAVASETAYEASVKLAGAMLQVNVYDSSNPTGEKVKSVSVNAPAGKLSGNITVGYDGKVKSVSGSGNTVSVSVDNPEIVVSDKASAKGIYIATVPAQIAANESGSVTYTVVTDGSVYEFAMTEAVEWEAGVVSTVDIDLANATKVEREKPIMSSTHPYTKGDFEMTETEPGVYTMEHVWLSGQEMDIYFPAGTSGFYYNAVDGWISSEDPEFDVVYSSEPVSLKVQQWGGKNYTEKYYTIILNINTMKLKVLQDRGERFWITGDNLSWDLNKYEMDVDKQTGIATWSGYLKTGTFKIHGEKLWEGEGGNLWTGPDGQDGSGEWYFYDSSRENGISMNSDSDHKWEIENAGYYTLEFNYKAKPMTFVITPKESLDITLNGQALKYAGNNQYTIETSFKKGEIFTLAGCKNLEYVYMDPDFLIKEGDSYKFNAVDGTYKFILNLQSQDITYADDAGKNMVASWTLFQGLNNDGIYSTLILAGNGIGNLTVNSKNQPGWSVTSPVQPYMAEIEKGIYQFTGVYCGYWEWQKPYNRWTWNLDFKYFGNTGWGDGTENGVNLVDNTGKIQQTSAGNLTWKDSNNYWEDGQTYRLTVNRNTNPHTVTFDKL
ncbi:MAG: DUF5121 domain-containing protein [Candidatus Cryptobacteroides sp.]|nr:DUF5121 domain-containing protein [Candidatus Cryptobacteroides sp.]